MRKGPGARKRLEAVRYSAFGVPYTLPLGDSNGDGSTNLGTDDGGICFDWDLDGDIDISDWSILDAAKAPRGAAVC